MVAPVTSATIGGTAAGRRDGRAARTERTTDAVVEALLALIDAGDLRPSARRIAERAEVSLRTVFHHFDDIETLYATAADRQLQRLVALTRFVPREGPLEDRAGALVAARAQVLEAVSPVRRAALLSEPFSPAVHARLAWARRRGGREIERVFAEELARRPAGERRELAAALTAAMSWSNWEELRAHQGLTPALARRVLKRTLMALLREGR
jgi:AcrR family transcriptional regulator